MPYPLIVFRCPYVASAIALQKLIFDGTRTVVTLRIKDNSPYDDDNTVNIVKDPSGLGLTPAPTLAPAGSSGGGGGGGGGGCFIATTSVGANGVAANGMIIGLVASVLAGLVNTRRKG